MAGIAQGRCALAGPGDLGRAGCAALRRRRAARDRADRAGRGRGRGQADWAEFLADCGKFEDELAKEIRTAKFTLAELEEEEQSLERLRRWHRDLTARDVFGAPQAAEAGKRLAQCTTACEDYTERVFRALHETQEDN